MLTSTPTVWTNRLDWATYQPVSVSVDEQSHRTSGSPAADLVLEVDRSVLVAEFRQGTGPIEIGRPPLTAPFDEEGLDELPHLLLTIRWQSSHEFAA